MDVPRQTSTPDADALYAALWGLVTPAATLVAVSEQPVLLALARVREAGSEPEAGLLAAAARDEIKAACVALEDRQLAVEPGWHHEGGAVLALLGLATGYQSAPLHRRREGAASLLGYEVGTAFKTRPSVRSHVQDAVYAVADKLWERDIWARARTSAVLAREQRPQLSELAVDTLRRYEAYYAMYTPLSALRADLVAAISLRREGDDEFNRVRDYDVSSLHAYAAFLLAKREFEDRFHGVWLFAQADIEQAMADSIKLIEHFSGLRYREESLLRLERAEHQELHAFIQQLETDEGGRNALRRWQERIETCECDPERPLPDCRVHKLMRACEYYTLVLDTDWYRVIPWHGGSPPNLGTVDAATLYRDVGLSPPPFM